MRRALTVIALGVVIALAALWWTGGFDRLAQWAAAHQRAFQNNIALSLRAVRAGQPEAVTALLSACFAYGVVHAAGPGHGKVLIGGYGAAKAVPMLRLSVIALLSSLGQAVTAVALVYTGVSLLHLGRERMISLTEAIMAPSAMARLPVSGCGCSGGACAISARRFPRREIITTITTITTSTTMKVSAPPVVMRMAPPLNRFDRQPPCARRCC